jgi:hypothetical protein
VGLARDLVGDCWKEMVGGFFGRFNGFFKIFVWFARSNLMRVFGLELCDSEKEQEAPKNLILPSPKDPLESQ